MALVTNISLRIIRPRNAALLYPSLQALLDLLEPYFSPLLDDLLDDVESGRTWTLGQVPEAVAKLNSNIMDIAHLIPPSFYRVSKP